MFEFDAQTLLRFFGVGFAAVGLAARLGLWKKWYWRTRGAVYGYLPMGIVFFLYTYNEMILERLGSNDFIYWAVIILLAIFVVWWSALPPAFVKPTWVRWIEKYPKRIIKVMADEVEAGEEWETYVESEEAVDRWAKKLKAISPKRSSKKKGT